ncbi:hypothetical protein L596_027010 [Steinernema carpocapsae]|uniref:Uncharacterized protein n=1 Tax=Steinernema carpocapsae TaxID=34508 RepID=A0A4U5M320_STECR|nr:hypothetical protein L596_027010 [Steinernema carpocapsae]
MLSGVLGSYGDWCQRGDWCQSRGWSHAKAINFQSHIQMLRISFKAGATLKQHNRDTETSVNSSTEDMRSCKELHVSWDFELL